MAQSPPTRPQWSPPTNPSSFRPDTTDNSVPPAKRPRLSPNPSAASSPYSQPSFPNSPYSNVPNYRAFQIPPNSFPSRPLPNGSSTPTIKTEHSPHPGMMGPPQRPSERPQPSNAQQTTQVKEEQEEKERHLDINDLSDLVTSSGVDIRKEEELMHASFHSRTGAAQPGSVPGAGQSFDLSQGRLGAIGDRGALNQPAVQNPEQELDRRHKAAARAFNERHQFELADPFFMGQAIRRRMERIANDNGVKVPMEGLFDKIGSRAENVTGQTMSNGKDTIAALKAPSLINKGAPLDPILSLLSVAGNERCRNLLEDAYGLARGRQITTDGIVPPEWAELVVSTSGTDSSPAKSTSQSLTQTSWDQPPDSQFQTNGGTTGTSGALDTVAFLPKSRPLNVALVDMIRRDRAAEEARLKKRAGRKAKKNAIANGIDVESTPQPEVETAAPSPVPARPPEIKMTKKEQEKARKAEVLSETQQTKAANSTMQAQLGGKKYAWMTGGAKKANPILSARPGAGLGGIATPPPRETSTKTGLPPSARDRKFGVWREDGAGGKNVQLRDWINTLEVDGREKKTLYFAMAKLGREKDEKE